MYQIFSFLVEFFVVTDEMRKDENPTRGVCVVESWKIRQRNLNWKERNLLYQYDDQDLKR